MATRKSNAKKATKKAELPKGFKAIKRSGDSWPNDDTAVGDELTGIVQGYEYIETKYSEDDTENVCIIETPEGREVKVWTCGSLRGLFEEDYTGYPVYLRYDGLDAPRKIGRKTVHPKMITAAVKE